MMHKWESVPKLISAFEHQDVGDPFIYSDFTYKLDEFDNVPPVIPRFQFYLQLNLKPLVVYLKELKDGQSVPSLREETLGLVKETKEEIVSTEQRLMEQVKMLNARCDDLQSQIVVMNKEKHDVE